MPVPVPRIANSPAHPVIKQPRRASSDQVVSLQYLSRTLPVSPTGPPPSFGTREQWINSLPFWRRTKPRRIWEEDTAPVQNSSQPSQDNMIVTADPVETRAFARACVSPIHVLFQSRGSLSPIDYDFGLGDGDGDADDEMSSDCSAVDHSRFVTETKSTPSSPSGCCYMQVGDSDDGHTAGGLSKAGLADSGVYNSPGYERGAFTPVFEEDSATHEVTSSPLEPVTPFGQFVDRAITSTQQFASDNTYPSLAPQQKEYGYTQPSARSPLRPQQSEQQMVRAPTIELIPTPGATEAYKKLAEPLAAWIADYVWKACTSGMSLHASFSRPSVLVKSYPAQAPDHLAVSVHSILLSTLLQPSAVFLALWYIIRLPVFFNATVLSAEYIKESHFREELLGHALEGPDRDSMESNAPFRLIILGFMLANKWLDDHTFSNKTWHSISNMPVRLLNRLEYLTLDIFSHDLSISCDTWSRWLAHVLSYHLSLSTQSYPQPISRPSTNPFSIIRKTIEELTKAPVACRSAKSFIPEPTFLGLEERRKERVEKEQGFSTEWIEVLEFDLDEDGPLPKEYLPKRRISVQQPICSDAVKPLGANTALPTPSRWSPADDEPVSRERSRVSTSYLPVQPPTGASRTILPHGHILKVAPQDGGYIPPNRIMSCYGSPTRHLKHLELAHHAYPYMLHIPAFHARSYSQSYDEDNYILPTFAQLQSGFDYRCSDIRTASKEPKPANRFNARMSLDRQYGRSYGYPIQLPRQRDWIRA